MKYMVTDMSGYEDEPKQDAERQLSAAPAQISSHEKASIHVTQGPRLRLRTKKVNKSSLG